MIAPALLISHAFDDRYPGADRSKVAAPKLLPPVQEVSQLSQRSAAVRDTQHSAQSASAHISSEPPSAVHVTGASAERADVRRAEPTPTLSARVSTHSVPRTGQPDPSVGAQAALPAIPSTQGHTRHGSSTLSGDGNMRASSVREDGTERSASMQTTRQGKSARVPLQERPRADAVAVRQHKVVTFQDPQSSRDGAHSAQKQQHSQPVQRASPANSKVTVKHAGLDGHRKESDFTGWDIADPNLCRPENYKPVKNPKEGDILFVKEAPFKIMYKVGSGASSKVR